MQGTLQVQAFRLAFTLGLENPLSGRAEVSHLHSHPALTQSHEACLGAYGLDIGAGKIVLLVDELVEVDIVVERHLGGVEGENLLLGRLCE